MAQNKIQIKRTSLSGKSPNTNNIDTGELALNITDGILYSTNGSVVFEVGANNTNAQVTGTLTVNTISANGTTGSAGQVLTTNGSNVYWFAVTDGTVTQVNTGVGLTGGPIDTTGTISVNPNTGIIANASGVFVNSAYIATLDANNASYLNGNTAATLRTYSETTAATSYTNATSYADTAAATAYSNAVSTASTDATNKAANAYSNAVSYAGTIAATAYSNAVSVASADATSKASTAYSNATSYAASIAATAYSNSVSYFDSNVNTAIDARVTKTFVDNLNVDADTLDSLNSTQFLRSDTADTATGAITFSANISVSTVIANSSPGTSGQVLTSNGTAVYWTDPAGGGGGYYFGDNGTVGDANNASNIFRVNNNSLNANVTFANGQNGSATGPLTVANGVTMTIQSGASVAIV